MRRISERSVDGTGKAVDCTRLMKKFVKRTLIFLVLMIAVIAGFVFFKSRSRLGKTYTVAEHRIVVPQSAAAIAEGKRLYISRGCIDCHGADLSGATFLDAGPIGRYTGSNLTKGKGGSAARLNDVEFERALRHGVSKNGKPLVFMPSVDFAGMSDEDTGRLIAYIRSAPPVDKVSPRQKIGPLARVLYVAGKMPLLTSAEMIDHNAQSPAKVDPTVSADYGKYIAQTCTGCHGTNLAGGPIPGAPPEWPPAQDIRGKALSKYNEAQFIQSIKTGKRPDGSEIRFPMPWKNFSQMTETEIKALFLYLKTL